MLAIITGDIINSRQEKAALWLPLLKSVLEQYGETPDQWEIFRGDSFQLAIPPEDALYAAIHLKAAIKEVKNLDVRIGIGIGEQDHQTDRISESNGTAFVRSGESFEALKKQNLEIRTGNTATDELLNLLFALALLNINTWSPIVAQAIRVRLESPQKSQTEIATQLQKSQSSLSEALKRGGYDEVFRLLEFYKKTIQNL